MKKLVLIAVAAFTAGCGSWGKVVADFEGYSRHCVDGVSYLQFPSGVTVQYAQDGSVVRCK